MNNNDDIHLRVEELHINHPHVGSIACLQSVVVVISGHITGQPFQRSIFLDLGEHRHRNETSSAVIRALKRERDETRHASIHDTTKS